MARYEITNKQFVNPYNFVTLEKSCRRGIDYKKYEGNITGYLECELDLITPIFIPNTTTVDDEGVSDIFKVRTKRGKEEIINSYDFFSYSDPEEVENIEERKRLKPEPVIPGSEIRGGIRSAFETLTNSCMSTIDDKQVLTSVIGSYSPCNKLNNLCPACNLFGLAGQQDSAISRLRFTDGKVVDDNYEFDDIRILKELASPKITATEFYLEKPNNALYWNYDYYIIQRDKEMSFEEKPYTGNIRGRKFYWHHNNPDPYIEIKDATKRNVCVRPLKKGKFKFKIYFARIKEDDLKRLIWVLEIGGMKDNAHKIGMGKPIGLGSVKISVKKIIKRVVEFRNGTIEYNLKEEQKPDLSDIDNKFLGCNEKTLKDFLLITKLKHDYNKIEYPNNVDSKEHFKWFIANRRKQKGEKFYVINQVLSPIDRPWLKKYKKKTK